MQVIIENVLLKICLMDVLWEMGLLDMEKTEKHILKRVNLRFVSLFLRRCWFSHQQRRNYFCQFL
jgi:hypothetical protein